MKEKSHNLAIYSESLFKIHYRVYIGNILHIPLL